MREVPSCERHPALCSLLMSKTGAKIVKWIDFERWRWGHLRCVERQHGDAEGIQPPLIVSPEFRWDHPTPFDWSAGVPLEPSNPLWLPPHSSVEDIQPLLMGSPVLCWYIYTKKT